MQIISSFFLLVFCLLSIDAQAKTFGLAMHGAPKYTSSAPHLDYVNPQAPKGGTLKQAGIGSFDTLNMYNIKGKPADGLEMITDRLMARVWDEPFTLYPLIAEHVAVSEDRSEMTIHINKRAQFHDGSPITADDVLFSFETLKEQGRPNMRHVYKLVEHIEKKDSHIVHIKFGDGYNRETAMILAIMPVLSKAYWQDRDFSATTLEPPLSSGPYKIRNVEAGRNITYERVENYWAADLFVNRGHHNFDEISFEYFRDDNIALESFKSGDLNFRREWNIKTQGSTYDFPAMKNGGAVKEEIGHGRASRTRGFIMNTRRAPFDDIRVRKALNLAFDFHFVNQSFFDGYYRRVNSYFSNTDLGVSDVSLPDHGSPAEKRKNLRQASQLLEEAGWVIKDGKRVSSHENGNENREALTFDILLDQPAQEKIALAFAKNLERLGITANIRVMDTATFRRHLNDYDFDMILYFFPSTLSPGTEQYSYWSCDSATQPARWNFAGICDKSIDLLVEKIAETKTRDELRLMTKALDRLLLGHHLMIPLYYSDQDIVAYWKPIQRPETTPLYGLVIETWWMGVDGQ